MSDKPKLSIIVPVYNSEKCLRKTIESALNQSLKNIEVICVNDGSTDESLSILENMQKKYLNLKVIDKKNAGVWKARIDGIKYANGEYIGFLDSDDILDENFAEKMCKKIQKDDSDIVVCGFRRIESTTGKVISKEMRFSNDRIIDTQENVGELISLNTAVWNKVFKAEILKKFDEIENPPRILEDMIFHTIVYPTINKITFVDDYLYDYMVANGSAMNSLKDSDVEMVKVAILQVKEQYLKNNVKNEFFEMLSSMAFLHIGISLMLNVYKYDKKNFNEEYKNTLIYLNKNFPEWKKTKFTRVLPNLKGGKYNLKVAIVRKVYILHLFKLFLWTYNFVTKTLKIDIKW